MNQKTLEHPIGAAQNVIILATIVQLPTSARALVPNAFGH